MGCSNACYVLWLFLLCLPHIRDPSRIYTKFNKRKRALCNQKGKGELFKGPSVITDICEKTKRVISFEPPHPSPETNMYVLQGGIKNVQYATNHNHFYGWLRTVRFQRSLVLHMGPIVSGDEIHTHICMHSQQWLASVLVSIAYGSENTCIANVKITIVHTCMWNILVAHVMCRQHVHQSVSEAVKEKKI